MRSRQVELQKQRQDLQGRIAAERRAPRADWSKSSFAWDAKLQEALTSTFGLTSFRQVAFTPGGMQQGAPILGS